MAIITLFPAAVRRRAAAQCSRYQAVFDDLEHHFAGLESGAITINQYLVRIADDIDRLQQQRPVWRRLGDRVGVFGRGERTAWREALAALQWCREWAIALRAAQLTKSMRTAGEVPADHGEVVEDLAA